jgi:hypothetical protein
MNYPAAAPVQVQWLQSVTKKIEAALLAHRLILHKDGAGYPLVDALCCGQKSLWFGKREVEDIVETIYHVLDANTPQPRPWVGLTDEEIISIDLYTLRTKGDSYDYTRAIEAALKEKNT